MEGIGNKPIHVRYQKKKGLKEKEYDVMQLNNSED